MVHISKIYKQTVSILLPELTVCEVCISGENVLDALLITSSIFIVEVPCSLAITESIGCFTGTSSSKATRAIFSEIKIIRASLHYKYQKIYILKFPTDALPFEFTYIRNTAFNRHIPIKSKQMLSNWWKTALTKPKKSSLPSFLFFFISKAILLKSERAQLK